MNGLAAQVGEHPTGLPHAEPTQVAGPSVVPLWDSRDVARFLKVSESWVRHRVAANAIPFMRVGGWMVRFHPAKIRGWAQASQTGAVRLSER